MAVRGQPAALPPLHWRNDPGYRSTSGLVVRPVGEDGSSLGVYDFASLPLTKQLTEAFAAAFDRHCGPGARARRQATCYSVFSALGRYARFLAAMDPPPKTVRDLRPASWDAYVLARGRSAGAHGELSNLRGFLPGVTGLPSETRRALARRLGKRPESEESAYSRGEFLRVRAAASHDVRALLRRIRAGRTHLARWRAGEFDAGCAEWSVGAILDDLMRGGGGDPEFPTDMRGGRQIMFENALGLSVQYPAEALFPESSTLWRWPSRCSAPPDGTVPRWIGCWCPNCSQVTALRSIAPRSSNTAVPPGWSTTRRTSLTAVGQAPGVCCATSSRPRRQPREAACALEPPAAAADRLLVHWACSPARLRTGVPDGHSIQKWSRASNLLTDDGRPLDLTPRRLRRSVDVHLGGPRHQSEFTYNDIYVLRDRVTQQASAPVIAAAQHAALTDARARVEMRMLVGAGADRVRQAAGVPLPRVDIRGPS